MDALNCTKIDDGVAVPKHPRIPDLATQLPNCDKYRVPEAEWA